MVLRDKSTPKLYFDNPMYTNPQHPSPPQPTQRLQAVRKEDLKVSKSVTINTNTHKQLDTRPSNLSHGGDFLGDIFTANDARKSRTHSMLAASLSPDCDFEEHIIENIRNRDFWSRRSRTNPFSRLRASGVRTSALAQTPPIHAKTPTGAQTHTTHARTSAYLSLASSAKATTPNHLQVPFEFPEDTNALETSEKLPKGDDDEEDPSEMMLEAQKESHLRENITWLRDYVTQRSQADGGNFNLESFLATMSNKELLARWFSLWDVRGDGELQQEEWIDHLKLSTTASGEVGAREWAELLEVLAYVVCGESGVVTEGLFTTILTSRGVLEKLFRLVNKDSQGLVSRQEIMDFIANLTYARPRTGFTRENLEWLEQLFRQALGHKQELSFEDFKKIVHSRNSFFAERVFQIFDRDNSGTVSLTEFLDAMHQFAGKSPNDKIKFLFRVYDLDGDGVIQQSELQQVMKACMEENGMNFSDDQIKDLTLAMFEDADTQNTGAISYESLKAQLEKHDGLLENLSISIDRWLVPPNLGTDTKDSLAKKVSKLWPYQMSLPYLRNNYVYLSFLFVYLSINLGLFISRAWEYHNSNWLTIVARACGQCLNFNCMFVLVLMLRQCITYLRSLGASAFLPLDQHLYLHKLCGWFIFGFSLVHTLMHLINFAIYIVPATGDDELNEEEYALWEWLLTMRPGLFGLIPGIANPTGVALIIILTIMVICSLPFVRKSGSFEVFYWTHLLYILFWALVILHGPNFWKWFVVPGIIFLVERIHRTIRMKTGRGNTYISSGVLLPSKVIHLVIKRPPNFNFHPGDYVFINIPEIAKYEWHPFTISSAPEQYDVLWLHIRAVGQWTNRLYDYFEREQQRCERERCELKISCGQTSLAPMTTLNGSVEYNTVKDDARNTSVSVYETPRSAPRLATKNGITNAAFEPDTEANGGGATVPNPPGALPSSPSLPPSPSSSPKAPSPRKRRLRKSCSVPEVENNAKMREIVMLRDASRSNSDIQLDETTLWEAQQVAIGDPATNDRRPFSNPGHAMSFKYIRRNPTVICLDLPSETESSQGDENDFQDDLDDEFEEDKDEDEGQGGDVMLTIEGTSASTLPDTQGNTVVSAEEGRLRRKSQGLLKEEEEKWRKKSQQDERRWSKVEERRRSRMEDRRKSRQEERRLRKKSRIEEVIAEGGCAFGKPLVIYMDGPFGAPSSHIFRAQHAVLIATGIGVTPFASILQSIMHKYWKARHSCPKCAHSWTFNLPHSVMNLRKVDFFWINRDQRSFEWFVNLLSQLEIEQAEQGGILDRFLDMHMYITSALQKTDMKAVGLQLALDLLHEKEKRDLITGLKTRTNAGRPNWDKVFKQLTNQQKGKITVFYCGPPALGRTLRYKCDEYGFDFRKEIF